MQEHDKILVAEWRLNWYRILKEKKKVYLEALTDINEDLL